MKTKVICCILLLIIQTSCCHKMGCSGLNEPQIYLKVSIVDPNDTIIVRSKDKSTNEFYSFHEFNKTGMEIISLYNLTNYKTNEYNFLIYKNEVLIDSISNLSYDKITKRDICNKCILGHDYFDYYVFSNLKYNYNNMLKTVNGNFVSDTILISYP